DNCLYIKVTDKGCGIPDIKKAMEPLFTTAPEEERAGLCFAVMEAFTDSLKVTSRVGKGTSVTMKKQLTNRFDA
ncbi:MAG: anti-sigma F factor, partial [Ruminiclostridium sp.]|nr:anti-sigma F factor [Ruminiclostridium sp.]